MLGNLGGRRLGRDGDGAAAPQGHDRRGAGLALGDGVVVGDDEPVATGQLGRRARVKGHRSCVGIANRTGELCRQCGRHMPVGIQPLGSRLRRRCRAIKPRIIKNGKDSLTSCIARPRQVRRDLLIGAGFIGNSCRKELVCIVLRRDVAANRDGSGIGSTGRLGRRCKSEDSCHGHHHDGQQAAVQFTHGDHLDPNRDGGEHASMSRQSTASKRRPNTS